MSWQAVTWVLELSESTAYSRLVLLSIASHANREGKNAFPSLDTIAREALISRREVIYCIQEMEERGELAVNRGIGRGNPNHYELPHVERWLEKVHSMHQLEELKGANKSIKGANQHTKGANKHIKPSLKPLESGTSTTERLEPSKAIKVKQLFKSFSIPEPPKAPSTDQAKIEGQRQVEALRAKGFL